MKETTNVFVTEDTKGWKKKSDSFNEIIYEDDSEMPEPETIIDNALRALNSWNYFICVLVI